MTQPTPEPNETEAHDGGPTYSNGETTVWYDANGEQHVEVNSR